MNLRKFTFIITLLLIGGCLSVYAQTDTVSVKTIFDKTTKYNSNFPVEKVYLHFDKPYYAVGDTIWFKAYLTIDLHQSSQVSKVIYVDVISGKDSVVQRLKLPVAGGIAFGNVTLNSPLYRQGNYRFRAYTNWMRNFDPSYFFNKEIAIGSYIDKDVFTTFSLSGSAKSNTAKVDATIHYGTPDGRPYSNRKVTWKVQSNDDETISKGKATTDNAGNITVNFTTNKGDAVNTSLLLTAIDIDSKTVNNSFPLRHATALADVQFFPEGGDMINGIKSKVAFKAIKPNGLGTEAKGSVTDNTGTVVATFTTQHLGMGVFDLLPENGKTYKATVTFTDGTQNTYELPKAKNDGVALAMVNTDPTKLLFSFTASDSFVQANKNKMMGFIAQCGQLIYYAAQFPATKNYSAAVLKSKFPTGVIKFTIFSPTGEALVERSVFVQRDDDLKLTLNTPKPTYATRGPVTFNVTAKKGDQPSLANLSVTVLDESKVPYDENSEITILTNLLLTSDLKGYVEKPNYYFNHVTDKTRADLDVLLLTQGYTRFLYADILANKAPDMKFLPENGIEVSGSLRAGDGMPVRGTVNFAIKDTRIKATVNTTSTGEFRFSKLFFADSAKATVDARGTVNANNMMILLNHDTYQALTPNINAPDEIANIDTALSVYLKNNKQQNLNSHVLKEVVIKDRVYVPKPSHADFSALSGLSNIPDHSIPGERLTACPSVYDCLKGMTPGITWNDDKLYLSRDYNNGSRTEAAIYLNGQQIDFVNLASVKPEEVEQVEVFSNDGVSGINRMTGTSGVVAITLKKKEKPKLDKELLNSLLTPQYSAVNFTPRGYSMARAFYNPKYDVTKTTGIGGDLRTTIYWNPKVITDKTGIATFDFYNSDGKGTYRAIIEGIDGDGNIGRAVYKYTVQ
jgi:hypothetical protein